MVNDTRAHLSYFRQDREGYHFRILPNGQYWPAIARLTRTAGKTLRYTQSSHEFHLPRTARALVLILRSFPVEYEIIDNANTNEITFDEKEKRGPTD